jgi:hypothetical protein
MNDVLFVLRVRPHPAVGGDRPRRAHLLDAMRRSWQTDIP